jgi:DNA-directed RNA polymerase subunit RPC12/RpoP
MAVHCPHCGSDDIRFSKKRGLFSRVFHLFGLYRFRCWNCNERFRANIWSLRYLPFAKCPSCHRMDLSRWSRDYYSPPSSTILMLGLGAKPVRCAYCRINFWSFRIVKERFDKRKRASRSQIVALPADSQSDFQAPARFAGQDSEPSGAVQSSVTGDL